MATKNPFDVLGDDDNDDPSSLIAIHQQKIAAKKTAGADSAAPSKAPAKLPTKPLPPAQAVREAKADVASRSGGGGGGRGGRGRGGRIGGATQNKDLGNGSIERFGGSYGGGGGGQDGEAGKGGSYGQPRQSYGGYRHGGYGQGDGDEHPPRGVFERRSGTGRGNDFKREGSGRGNWGTVADDVIAQESVEAASVENASPEKKPDQENAPGYEAKKEKEEGATNDDEQKEEVKEMTLEEYEKVREEKRKALISMKAKERKVDVDKEFQSMQQLSLKKENDDVFIKLGSDKDSRKQKDNADKDEKTKKSVSINEFLKPAAGGRYNGPGGRGRGRGRGGRGGFERGDSATPYVEAMIKIEDPGQFPILGGK